MTPDDYRAVLRQVSEGSRPTGDQIRAVRQRLDQQLEPTGALLRHLPEASPAAVQRLRRRLAEPAPRPGFGWAAPLLGGGLALAAMAALSLRVALPGPAALAEPTILASTSWASSAPSDVLQLDYRGSGALDGEGLTWALDWREGSVALKVAKDRGAKVQVKTEEALVEVVGTQFQVDRDALGTSVQVTEGRVRVTCVEEPPVTIGAGERVECLPLAATDLLGRAVALAERGAPPEQRRATLLRGLERVQDPSTHAELLRHQLEVQLLEADAAGALKTALAHQALAGARGDVARLALRLALQQGDCTVAAAQGALLSDLQEDERAALDACLQ